MWLPGHLCRWGAVESVDLWWGQVLFPQTTRRVGRLWLRELRAESALWLYGATAAGRPEWRAWTDGSWGTEPENHRERERNTLYLHYLSPFECGFSRWKALLSHSLESCGFPRWIFQFKSLKKPNELSACSLWTFPVKSVDFLNKKRWLPRNKENSLVGSPWFSYECGVFHQANLDFPFKILHVPSKKKSLKMSRV